MDSIKNSATAAASSALAAAVSAAETSPEAAPPVIVLDMKGMSRKKLRRLRKGRGRAMAEMTDALDEFRQNGTIGANAQIVIAIVKQKEKRPKPFWSR